MNAVLHIRQNVLGVSQAEFAAIAHTSQATVSRWESGELEPNLGQMDAIRRSVIERGLRWEDRWFFEIPGNADA